MNRLPSPKELKQLYPVEKNDELFLQETRDNIQRILRGEKKQKLLIAGPCSIHDESSTLEYADRFLALSEKVKNFFFVLRFFIEKPRTSLGWTGFLNDPMLDGSCRIDRGLMLSRKLLKELVQKKIPCAMEFLHPSFAPYFTDLVSWGVIGSRTSSSQIHRQLASSLPFPVGFKNSHFDAIDITLQSIRAARSSHVFPSIDEEGRIVSCRSKGNPFAHVVLRGNREGPNHDEKSIHDLLKKSASLGFALPIIVDCSHENSSKNLERQKECFRRVVLQKNETILGYMLESHLFSGNQSLSSGSAQYGISVTDPCLGWEETKDLILACAHSIA